MIALKGEKQPGETMDYDVLYADWFSTRSDMPVSVELVSVDTGITLFSITLNTTTKTVKIILTGGVVGVTYKITYSLTTSSGIVKEDEIVVKVKEY